MSVNEKEVFYQERNSRIIKSITSTQIDDTTIRVTFKGNIVPVSKHRELNIVKNEMKKRYQDYNTTTDSDNLKMINHDNISVTYELIYLHINKKRQ